MNIMELVSNEHKDLMKRYIECYIGANKDEIGHEMAPMDKILAPWARAKSEYLDKMFNGSLILSKKISYEKGVDEMFDEVYNKLLNNINYGEDAKPYEIFIKEYRELTSWRGPYYENYQLAYLLEAENLADNIYHGSDFSFETPEGEVITVKNGTKTIKALGKIAKALNLPNFEDFRLEHSRVLNQKKLTGNLCISIHPLDYMTMSDNECGWSSCMSWIEDGDYRRGTVEMMNSPCVVVAYLTSDKDMTLMYGDESSKWSNKKWRELFIVTKEMIGGIKAYPYCNENLETEVATWLRELAINNLGWEYYDTMDTWNYAKMTDTDHGTFKIVPRAITMYNDHRDGQRAYIAPTMPKYYNFFYSGDSECMWCGETCENVEFSNSRALICNDCYRIITCACCGDEIEGEVYYIDDEPYCYYCYNENTVTCDECHETVHADNSYTIPICVDIESNNRSGFAVTFCGTCYDAWINGDEDMIKRYGSPVTLNKGTWNEYVVIDIYNLSDEMFRYYIGMTKEQFFKAKHENLF